MGKTHDPSAFPTSLLAHYHPPFDLTSDFLFAFAFAPTRPIAQYFSAMPIVSLAGRTPLVIWFSRVRHIRYGASNGERQSLGAFDKTLYYELNVMIPLKARALFVPAIYATSHLTIEIGHTYGMPKEFTAMEIRQSATRFHGTVKTAKGSSFVHAHKVARNRLLEWLAPKILPLRLWKTRFPSNRWVKPLIQGVPRAEWYRIAEGVLDLQEPWFPEPVGLLPIGLYLPQQQMQLPPPPTQRSPDI